MEKNMKKNVCVCVYVTESLCCTAEINTSLEVYFKEKKKNLYSFLKNPAPNFPRSHQMAWPPASLINTVSIHSPQLACLRGGALFLSKVNSSPSSLRSHPFPFPAILFCLPISDFPTITLSPYKLFFLLLVPNWLQLKPILTKEKELEDRARERAGRQGWGNSRLGTHTSMGHGYFILKTP